MSRARGTAAFRRFMAAALTPPAAPIDGFSDDDVCDRAMELARPLEPAGDEFLSAVRWTRALCAALRSESRFERLSAEFALARIHHELLRPGRAIRDDDH